MRRSSELQEYEEANSLLELYKRANDSVTDVILDTRHSGPFSDYLQSAAENLEDILRHFAHIDPTSVAEVSAVQRQLHTFFSAYDYGRNIILATDELAERVGDNIKYEED